MILQPSFKRILFLLVVFAMVGGLRQTLAQPIDGDWSIPTNFGQFVITVANSGTVISKVATTFSAFSCGGITQSGTLTSSNNPPPSITDRQFAITQSIGLPGSGIVMNYAGTFTASGTEASGSWSLSVSGTICDGTWGPVVNVSVDEMDGEIPKGFTLAQAYPNPFNPRTNIRFDLSQPAYTILAIYDVIGKEVARLIDGPLPASSHEVSWDAVGLPTGLYFYTLMAGGFTETKTLILVK